MLMVFDGNVFEDFQFWNDTQVGTYLHIRIYIYPVTKIIQIVTHSMSRSQEMAFRY